MIMEEPVGTRLVAVGPGVHPERPVEVGPASGQLGEPQTHLGARHGGHDVAVAAPRRLGPEHTSWCGIGSGRRASPDTTRSNGSVRRGRMIVGDLDTAQTRAIGFRHWSESDLKGRGAEASRFCSWLRAAGSNRGPRLMRFASTAVADGGIRPVLGITHSPTHEGSTADAI